MTFVAQPYEQFVDDLLTALTGGLVREEHQFVGIEEPYSLGSPEAIASSIKVFGQSNDKFVFFEMKNDFNYDSDKEIITWEIKGKIPDDHSFFYVNYYTQEGRRKLTDRNPGSVTTTLAEAFAREFAVLHKQMELIYRSAFVDLATGYSLDHVAALLDINRKDAKFASGEVIFKSSSPVQGDITIPAGTLVSTDQGLNFETTDKRTLRKGQLTIACPIRAHIEGPAGLITKGAIKYISRPIFGIESVANEAPTFFATAKETDEELRRRIKGTLERAGKATVDAIKYGLIEDLPEITENNIQVEEQTATPGSVEVRLALGTIPDADLADLVKRIEESIFYSRAAGVRVTHNLTMKTNSESAQQAGAKSSAFSGKAISNEEKGKLPSVRLSQGNPENGAILSLRAEVRLRLSKNFSVKEREKIEDDVSILVEKFIKDLPMGTDLIYNKLLGLIAIPEEIADVSLCIGMKSGSDLYKSNLAIEGRKSEIDIHDISVGLMEEAVLIDVTAKLESGEEKAKSGGIDPESLQKIIDSACPHVKEAINRKLAEVSGKLLKSDIKSEIQKTIAPQLQFIQGDAVAINAIYEETGRILNNTDEVALEGHQVLRLKNLVLTAPGVLDV